MELARNSEELQQTIDVTASAWRGSVDAVHLHPGELDSDECGNRNDDGSSDDPPSFENSSLLRRHSKRKASGVVVGSENVHFGAAMGSHLFAHGGVVEKYDDLLTSRVGGKDPQL